MPVPTPPAGYRLMGPDEYPNRNMQDVLYSPEEHRWVLTANIGRNTVRSQGEVYARPETATIPEPEAEKPGLPEKDYRDYLTTKGVIVWEKLILGPIQATDADFQSSCEWARDCLVKHYGYRVVCKTVLKRFQDRAAWKALDKVVAFQAAHSPVAARPEQLVRNSEGQLSPPYRSLWNTPTSSAGYTVRAGTVVSRGDMVWISDPEMDRPPRASRR